MGRNNSNNGGNNNADSSSDNNGLDIEAFRSARRTRHSKKAVQFNARPAGYELNAVWRSADNPDSWASAVHDTVEAYEDRSAKELYDSLLGNQYEQPEDRTDK